MSIAMLKFILFLIFLESSSAAIPNCEQGKKCPPGGLWGEWTTVGSEACKQECGSCAELFQTRTCLSSEFAKQFPECACTGDFSRYIPCNMKVCQYPMQRTCCVPYLPMVINGIQSCGPQPRSMREPTASCCPIGGLWSEWSSGYQNINNQWLRTRRCVSESVGCKCTGSPTIGDATCPCPLLPSAASDCPSVPNGRPTAWAFLSLIIDHPTCTAYFRLYNNNDQRTFCSSLLNYTKPYPWVPLLILNYSDGECGTDYVSECQNYGWDGHTRSTFTCNTDTVHWVHDNSGKEIKSYVQAEYINYIPL